MILQTSRPSRGSPYEPSASVQSALIDGVNDLERERIAGASARTPESETSPACTVHVTNETGANRAPGDIVSITSALADWPDFPREAARRPALEGSTPAAISDVIAVLLDEIPHHATEGYAGRAAIAGVVTCKVQIGSTSHKYAVPTIGDATKLTSAATGSIRILKAASGTGLKEAVVQLQCWSVGERGRWLRVTSTTAASGSYPAVLLDDDGSGGRVDGDNVRFKLITGAGDSVVDEGVYWATLIGRVTISDIAYDVYDGVGNVTLNLPDCDPEDEATEGYRPWKFYGPTERGEFVVGAIP